MSSGSQHRTSNLQSINSTFQKHCWNLNSHLSSPSLILCDYPSAITNPQPHFKIFGLDDFPHFLHSIESSPDLQIIVFTQQYSILAKLISSTHSVQRPFKLHSRSHGACPFELKIIEISAVVPFSIFQKATKIQYHTTFQVRLANSKGPFIKHFDLFELDINPIIEDISTLSPIPPLQICGFAHTTNYNLYEEISKSLQNIAIPYSHDNNLQASVNPLSHIISFNITPASSSTVTSIQSLIDQLYTILNPIPSFLFCALISEAFSLSNSSHINFISKRKMDPAIITPLFSNLSVPFLLINSGLVFVASLEVIEEVILLAPQHNISIPSHFLQNIQKFTFELTNDHIKISLLKITTPHFTDLQKLRLDPGCPTEIFFTQQSNHPRRHWKYPWSFGILFLHWFSHGWPWLSSPSPIYFSVSQLPTFISWAKFKPKAKISASISFRIISRAFWALYECFWLISGTYPNCPSTWWKRRPNSFSNYIRPHFRNSHKWFLPIKLSYLFDYSLFLHSPGPLPRFVAGLTSGYFAFTTDLSTLQAHRYRLFLPSIYNTRPPPPFSVPDSLPPSLGDQLFGMWLAFHFFLFKS